MLHILKSFSFIKSDIVGISASFACIVHCLAAPALVSLGYVFNFSLVGQWHWLDYIFIGLAVVAVYFSTKNTRSTLLKIMFWVFAFLFSGSILLHELVPGLELVTLGSSLVLIFLHFLRLRIITSKRPVKKSL